MISLGAGRVRAMVHTRGEPSDIELAAAHAFFYHPSPGRQRDQPRVRLGADRVLTVLTVLTAC